MSTTLFYLLRSIISHIIALPLDVPRHATNCAVFFLCHATFLDFYVFLFLVGFYRFSLRLNLLKVFSCWLVPSAKYRSCVVCVVFYSRRLGQREKRTKIEWPTKSVIRFLYQGLSLANSGFDWFEKTEKEEFIVFCTAGVNQRFLLIRPLCSMSIRLREKMVIKF